MSTSTVLLVHGGAWAMPDDAREAHSAGVRNALAAGYALLQKGASAVDAVEAAVAVLMSTSLVAMLKPSPRPMASRWSTIVRS